ncbi:MAG: monovalent cation/H(+) antiporter subunit G [Propionicimonas sp.]|uniref:monovalent cation/H(+) antiporter subunit G n=1 Tax=Propionicimonas sp. TaxID=1955623 RepID=UPI002B20E9EA|nr:monovalent cation/H(+) antiporter subunit G [Propionicimonas sp.]MEA4943021.1 monovalent cation/H(+) antiporter subunit G [Propionicimonas sp.]MEA5055148.1 monovalent cation/H(+) antiporter subunit G [Propionicimonas sp.]MEA5118160.1 monovalent cation/H(+) antiporter subunit G [Propionicimonas sp.]
MTAEQILDLAGAVVLALGCLFCLAAAVGLVRFPDVLTRMHGATKPQVFGLILVLTGVTLSLRDGRVFAFLSLAVLMQVLTAPVSGHLVSRTAHRNGDWDAEHAVVDDLARDIAAEVAISVPPPEPEPEDRG